MNLTNITKITTKAKKRVGQGHGSGRGKTSGRGTKGQLARHKSRLDFDGDANPLIRRLPFLRGKGRNKSLQAKSLIINLSALNVFSDGAVVDVDTLAKHRLIKTENIKKHKIKILGDGELKKSLTIKLPISKNAAKKIEKAGGKIG
jgi:large subunit ribosomal protein L15